jgi:uncharacterized protein (TIRG00374 family)
MREYYRDFMEKKRAKNLLMNGLMFAVGFVIIGIMISFIGAENVIDEMSRADPVLVVLAVGIMLIILSVKMVRWWILLAEANFPNASRVYLIGQTMNLFAPIGTGEVMRAAIAKNKLGIKARETMAAVVIERIADITFLVAMSGIGVIFFVPGGAENYIFLLLLAAIIAVAFLLIVKPQLFDRLALFIERTFEKRGRFLSKLSLKISLSMTKFKEAILKFHKRKPALGAHMVITIVSWIMEATVTYILLIAVGANPPFILIVLVINATSWVVRTFLFLPVGPKEVTFIFLMGLFEIDAGDASAVALIMLALSYIVLGSGAVVSIITFGKTKVSEDDKEGGEAEKENNVGESEDGDKGEENNSEEPSSEDNKG